jgi:hypothetical protein
VLARWPKTLQLEIPGLVQVLFCHSTPRSETECFTRLTVEDRLPPLFEPLQVGPQPPDRCRPNRPSEAANPAASRVLMCNWLVSGT